MAGLGSLHEVLFAPVLPADALDALVYYYSVEADNRYAGLLESWERDESGRPVALIVARGWFGSERFRVPFEKLVEVDHDHQRLTVDSDAVPPSPRGPLDRLLEVIRPTLADHTASLLCVLDDDADTRSVLGVARELAAALDVPLVLARHASAKGAPSRFTAPAETGAPQPLERQLDADLFIDELVSRPQVRVVGRVRRTKSSATNLAELAIRERARLVVVGCQRDPASTARDFTTCDGMASLSCPVVVVPPRLPCV